MAQQNYTDQHNHNHNQSNTNGYGSTTSSILNKPLVSSSFIKEKNNYSANKFTRDVNLFNSKPISDFKNPLNNKTNGHANNTNNVSCVLTSDIEKELTDLTLSIEREMEKQKQNSQSLANNSINSNNIIATNSSSVSNSYFNICFKCSKPITKRTEACQAMGNIYHNSCFLCFSCGRSLKGKSFYNINNNVYCEEDYLYSGFLENAEKCAVCGHIIVDMILQAIGKSYHPGCFRCCNCNDCLDGLPFTLDVNNRIYCVADYYKKYAPKCAKCKQAITPTDGSSETIRIVSMEQDYHVDCFVCELCGTELSDEPKKRCYPIDEKLFCYDCHVKNLDADTFTKNIFINSNNELNNSITIDKKK